MDDAPDISGTETGSKAGLEASQLTRRDHGFIRLAVQNGFITEAQADDVLDHLKSAREFSDDPLPVENVVVSEGLMTNDQATAIALAFSRLRKDAEKRRWSISGYEIYHKIGEGGLGVVFKAKQVSMNRLVALKILHKRWINDDEFKKRFLVEARLVGKLSHQNLIKVFDVGREDWKYYFSMEFIEHETVDDLIEQSTGGMDLERALGIVIQITRAIKYLKGYDIVHCDIKPSNILLTPDGIAKLGDFGFVKSRIEIKLQDEGSVLGTPDYIAPEQAMGKDVNYLADVYSLGATLYHMVTGQPPYQGSISTKMKAHIKGDCRSPLEIKPDLPPAIARMIQKMMARKPEDRYTDFAALFDDLERLKAVVAKPATTAAAPTGVPGTMTHETPETADPRAALRLWRLTTLGLAALAAASVALNLWLLLR